MSTMTHSTITRRILPQFQGAITGACTSQLVGMNAPVGFAARRSGAIRSSAQNVAPSAGSLITQESRENAGQEAAYSLTVDKDECYFVRGSDGRGYLVSNSSHGSDSFGLMCVVAESYSGHGSAWYDQWDTPVNLNSRQAEPDGYGYRRRA